MIANFCAYDARDEILVAYLYDDIAPDARAAFERHLIGCGTCRAELEALGAVRTELGAWLPPERGGQFTFESTAAPAPRTSGRLAIIRELPAWAQFAAAMLVFGVSAGVANVNVSYGQDGWALRTGWIRAAPAAPVAAAVPVATRDDIAAMERRLRGEFEAMNAASIAAAASGGTARVQNASTRADANGDELIRRLRALVQDSERRQQRELALRLADVVRDVQTQRQADLVKIDRTLGLVQNNTGMAIRDQQQLLNNLAVRVSSQR
jgi:anti-sigma factor RsiW